MLETLLDRHIVFVLLGILTAVGIMSKFIVNVALKRLVRAAGNMNKSNHPLMRLVRAKFEHASMVSDKVENVSVFVDKYLYEYKVLGLRIHTWRRLEKASAGLCLLVGAAGAGLEYGLNGMKDMVGKTGAVGGGLAAFVYLIHLVTDEKYQLEAVRNYMVDFLENVCRHRFEKSYQKEIKVLAHEGAPAEFGAMPVEGKEGAGDTYAVREKETEEDLYAVRNLELADESLYGGRSKKQAEENLYGERSKKQAEENLYGGRSREQVHDNLYEGKSQKQMGGGLYEARDQKQNDNLYEGKSQKQMDGGLYEARDHKQTDESLYGGRSQGQTDEVYASGVQSQMDEPYAVRKREASQGQSAVSAFLAAELKAGESVFRDQTAEKDIDLGVDEPVNAFSAFQMPVPGRSEGGATFRTSEGIQKESVEIEAPRGREKRKEKIVEIPVPDTAREPQEPVVVEKPGASSPSKNPQLRQAAQKEREEIDRDVVIRRILEEFMA